MPKVRQLTPSVIALLALACGGTQPAPSPTAATPSTSAAAPPAPTSTLDGLSGVDVPRVRIQIDGYPWFGAERPLVHLVEVTSFEAWCEFCFKQREIVPRLAALHPDAVRVVSRFKANKPVAGNMPQVGIFAARAAHAVFHAHGPAAFAKYRLALLKEGSDLNLKALVRHAHAFGPGRGDQPKQLDAADPLLFATNHRMVVLGQRAFPMAFINGRPVPVHKEAEAATILRKEIDLAKRAAARGFTGKTLYAALMNRAGDTLPGKRVLDRSLAYRIPVDGSPTLGPATAPVTIVAFVDFECPFSRTAQFELAELRKKYGDKLRVVYKHRPLAFHRRAKPAARVAAAVYQFVSAKAFWKLHHTLFAQQHALRDTDLKKYGTDAGLSEAQVSNALTRDNPLIARDSALAEKFGSRGTPAFFINGRLITGAHPLATFQERIDAALAEVAKLPGGGTPYERVLASASVVPIYTLDKPVADRPKPGPIPRQAARGWPVWGKGPQLLAIVTGATPSRFDGMPSAVRKLANAHPQLTITWQISANPAFDNSMDVAAAARELLRQKGKTAFLTFLERIAEHAGPLDRAAIVTIAGKVPGARKAAVASALKRGTHRTALEQTRTTLATVRVAHGASVHELNGARRYGKINVSELGAAVDARAR